MGMHGGPFVLHYFPENCVFSYSPTLSTLINEIVNLERSISMNSNIVLSICSYYIANDYLLDFDIRKLIST